MKNRTSNKEASHSQTGPNNKGAGKNGTALFQNNQDSSSASSILIQRKLTIGSPNDPYEREADDIASNVMRKIKGTPPEIQKKCKKCGKEEMVQRKEAVQSNLPAPTISSNAIAPPLGLKQQLQQAKGGGTALPNPLKPQMESAFGTDFSKVRVHDNTRAAQMADSIQAKAFTHGNDIFFNQGRFQSNSYEGKKLLAHELTHVEQQAATGNRISRNPLPPKKDQQKEGLLQDLKNESVFEKIRGEGRIVLLDLSLVKFKEGSTVSKGLKSKGLKLKALSLKIFFFRGGSIRVADSNKTKITGITNELKPAKNEYSIKIGSLSGDIIKVIPECGIGIGYKLDLIKLDSKGGFSLLNSSIKLKKTFSYKDFLEYQNCYLLKPIKKIYKDRVPAPFFLGMNLKIEFSTEFALDPLELEKLRKLKKIEEEIKILEQERKKLDKEFNDLQKEKDDLEKLEKKEKKINKQKRNRVRNKLKNKKSRKKGVLKRLKKAYEGKGKKITTKSFALLEKMDKKKEALKQVSSSLKSLQGKKYASKIGSLIKAISTKLIRKINIILSVIDIVILGYKLNKYWDLIEFKLPWEGEGEGVSIDDAPIFGDIQEEGQPSDEFSDTSTDSSTDSSTISAEDAPPKAPIDNKGKGKNGGSKSDTPQKPRDKKNRDIDGEKKETGGFEEVLKKIKSDPVRTLVESIIRGKSGEKVKSEDQINQIIELIPENLNMDQSILIQNLVNDQGQSTFKDIIGKLKIVIKDLKKYGDKEMPLDGSQGKIEISVKELVKLNKRTNYWDSVPIGLTEGKFIFEEKYRKPDFQEGKILSSRYYFKIPNKDLNIAKKGEKKLMSIIKFRIEQEVEVGKEFKIKIIDSSLTLDEIGKFDGKIEFPGIELPLTIFKL